MDLFLSRSRFSRVDSSRSVGSAGSMEGWREREEAVIEYKGERCNTVGWFISSKKSSNIVNSPCRSTAAQTTRTNTDGNKYTGQRREAFKFILSKHQQIQLLEAAAILSFMGKMLRREEGLRIRVGMRMCLCIHLLGMYQCCGTDRRHSVQQQHGGSARTYAPQASSLSVPGY